METVYVMVIILLVGGALAVVLYPLLRRSGLVRLDFVEQDEYAGNTADELNARYAATLAALKDLDFDNEMGKISAEDYQATRLQLARDAAALLQQLDQLASPDVASRAPDADIEELLARFKADGQGISPPVAAEIKAEIEALKQREAVSADPDLACPQCGQPVHPKDAFCSACGTALSLHCPACGKATMVGDAFCAHCGTALLKEGAIP